MILLPMWSPPRIPIQTVLDQALGGGLPRGCLTLILGEDSVGFLKAGLFGISRVEWFKGDQESTLQFLSRNRPDVFVIDLVKTPLDKTWLLRLQHLIVLLRRTEYVPACVIYGPPEIVLGNKPLKFYVHVTLRLGERGVHIVKDTLRGRSGNLIPYSNPI